MTPHGLVSAAGEFTEFESPWDLDAQRIEKLRHCGPLLCACAPERQLPLAIVLHPTLPHVRRLRELDDHAPECVFNRALEARTSGPDLWHDSIIEATTPADVAAFRLLARCLLSRAYTTAIVNAAGSTELVRICAALRTEITAGYYLSSGRPLTAARAGTEIVCGVANGISPVAPNDGPFPLVGWEIAKTGLAPRPSCFFCDARALAPACRAITVFGQRIRGPYLLIGIRRESLLVAVVLFPVVISIDRIAPVDSDLERHLVRHYWSASSALLKPLRRRELNAIPADWRSRCGELLDYQYRPDLLLRTDDGPTIVELKGFESEHTNASANYAVSFAAKSRYWRNLANAGRCHFVERTAREFREPQFEESR